MRMVWNRRVKVGASAGLATIVMAGAWYLSSRTPATKTFSMTPTSLAHPIVDRTLKGGSGQPLLNQHRVAALMVVPDQLPAWVRQDLKGHVRGSLLKDRQFLWNGSSILFKKAQGWSVTGIYPTTLMEWVAASGMSPRLVAAWANIHGEYSSGPVLPQNGTFVLSTPRSKSDRLAWSQKLTRQVGHFVKSGGAVAVIDGEGRLRTLMANPGQRGIGWEPRPVGLGLVPPLTAQALGSQGILLKIKGSANLLGQLAGAWGANRITRGLRRLGIGTKITLLGQPVDNPALPKASTTVMSQGHALWATPLEIARAYLPFVQQGLLPKLTASANPPPVKTEGLPLVASPADLSQVASVLPKVMVGGLKFSVWRPDGNFAVAFSDADGGIVIVAEGPATNSILQLVHVVSGWMHQSVGAKKQGKSK